MHATKMTKKKKQNYMFESIIQNRERKLLEN